MSKSFKLDTSKTSKQELAQGGILLIILAIVIGLFWDLTIALWAGMLGLVLFLGGTFASGEGE